MVFLNHQHGNANLLIESCTIAFLDSVPSVKLKFFLIKYRSIYIDKNNLLKQFSKNVKIEK